MTYDNWKTESPEDEDERMTRAVNRNAERMRWLEDHADELNYEREERRREFDDE